MKSFPTEWTQLLSCFTPSGNTSIKNAQIDVLYLNFTKPFDFADHAVLIKKLKRYGVKVDFLNGFIDYLDGRRQRVIALWILFLHNGQMLPPKYPKAAFWGLCLSSSTIVLTSYQTERKPLYTRTIQSSIDALNLLAPVRSCKHALCNYGQMEQRKTTFKFTVSKCKIFIRDAKEKSTDK